MRTPKVDMRITPTCTIFLFSQPTGHFQWPFTCSRLTTSSMSVPGLSGDSAAAAKANSGGGLAIAPGMVLDTGPQEGNVGGAITPTSKPSGGRAGHTSFKGWTPQFAEATLGALAEASARQTNFASRRGSEIGRTAPKSRRRQIWPGAGSG